MLGEGHALSAGAERADSMAPPDPLAFQLRTSKNASPLDCRVYHAPKTDDATSLDIAIVAHPYGPLGGSYDDPVVQLIVRTLIEAGYHAVGVFNFRRPSWTLKPERDDYSSFAMFLMHYMINASPQWLAGVNLLMAGYSYGSMVASQIYPASYLMAESRLDECQHLIVQAEHLASQRPGAKLADAEEQTQRIDALGINTMYLLVSPLLPLVSWAVAPFNNRQSLVGRRAGQSQWYPSLAVFGTSDTFTSSKRLKNFAKGASIESSVVKDASHFWQSDDDRSQLATVIRSWVKSLQFSNIDYDAPTYRD